MLPDACHRRDRIRQRNHPDVRANHPGIQTGLTRLPARAIPLKPGLLPAGQRAMPIRLDSRSADFAARFAALLATKREVSEDVEQAVRAIIEDVRRNGDRALVELSRKFDRIDLGKVGLRVSAADLD